MTFFRAREFWSLCGAVVLIAAVAIGCEATNTHDIESTVRQVARDIEPLARASEEWGTISMSNPLLVNTGPEHRFKLSHSADDYFRFARSDINAAVFTSRQEALDTQFGLKLTANIDEVLANLAALDKFGIEKGEFDRYQRTQRRTESFGEVAKFIRTVQPLIGLGVGAAQGDVLAAVLAALDGQVTPNGGGAAASAPAYPAFPALVTTTQPVIDADVLPTTRPAQSVLSSQQFTAPFSLPAAASQPSATALNDAILEAHSAHSIASILNLLSDQERGRFRDKRVLVGVAMVSVNPGWRTYRNYAAELTVDVSYQRVNATKYMAPNMEPVVPAAADGEPLFLQFFMGQVCLIADAGERSKVTAQALRLIREGEHDAVIQQLAIALGRQTTKDQLVDEWSTLQSLKSGAAVPAGGGSLAGGAPRLAPLVAAISPLTQSQNLDLRSSIREQIALALKISAALKGLGAAGQAAFFSDYVNRLEQDAASRTTLNTIVARSHAGGKFGYRISPSFRALQTPGSKDPSAGMVLEPQTFPVLIVFGIDTSDKTNLSIPKNGHVQLHLSQTLQWMPVGNAHKDDAFLGLGFALRDRTRVSESDRMDWAIKASQAHAALNELPPAGGSADKSLETYARLRIEALASQTLASSSWQDIPNEIWEAPAAPSAPTVSNMLPREGRYDLLTDNEVLLVGENLARCDQNSIRVVISPRKTNTIGVVSAFSPAADGRSATLRFSVQNPDEQEPALIYFELRPAAPADGAIATITPPFLVRAKSAAPPNELKFSVVDKDGQSRVISYDPRINLDVIRAYLQSLRAPCGNESDGSVNVRVETNKNE